MSDVWNPEQYEKFKAERAQPFYDLLELIEPAPDSFAVDLGILEIELRPWRRVRHRLQLMNNDPG